MNNNSSLKTLTVHNLKCNYLINPLGVETGDPLLSWEVLSDQRGQYQKAYRIIAASEPSLLDKGMADLWDSGIIKTDNTIHVPYGGSPLKSRQKVFWKVLVQGSCDDESVWSETASFEMGLLNESEWKAKWICSPSGGTDIKMAVPAPLFRKTFALNKKVTSARVYICGLGYYELYLNGVRIGNEVLTPAFTRYDETVLYNTYDVTENISMGENVAGVILGNGWYNCFTSEVWDYMQAPWRHHPKLIMQLHIVCEDGEELTVCTDKSWKVSESPIRFDGLRNGEFYDARLEKPQWSAPGFDDGDWTSVGISRSPGGVIKSFQMTPIRITGTIKPIGLKEVKPGVWVYDLGQNISGWARLRVSGSAGTEITIKYSDMLNEDGTIDQSVTGLFIKSGESQTDKYILKGKGVEEWEPRFTYHGFQYAQITGLPGTPTLDNLCGRVVHTDLNTIGEFECSNELLNKIQKCVRWSTLTNYHGIPTDCPQREKNGWTGDAMLSAEQVLLNFDPMTAYTKWMQDFKDIQRPSGQLPGIIPTGGWSFNWGSGPAWDSAVILVPWYMYLYCGDTAILEEMYENMKRYIEYMSSMAEENLVDFGLGDWCPPIGGAGDHKCPTIVTDTAYYYQDSFIMSKIAALLGKHQDSEMFSTLAGNIREAFRNQFYNAETGKVTGDCQTSLACALYQGLVNEDEKQLVLENLIKQIEEQDFHIDCGILGAKYMMHTLSDMGRTDLAYKIATQTTFPGWGHWIAQGATTLWETWDGKASRNHHMFSDISAWFYKGLAGINPDPEEPGFKHVILRPNPIEELRWVNCTHQSMYGRITCNWRVDGDAFKIEVEIPTNCHATLYIPKIYSMEVKENGKQLNAAVASALINVNSQFVLKLVSGKYNIAAK